MIEGAWVVAEGAIYSDWDEDRHVVDELPTMRQHFLGIDYDTTDPFSAVLLGMGDDDRLYAVAEWRFDSRAAHRSMTDAQYAAVREWLADYRPPDAGPGAGKGVMPEWTFVDPSAKSFSTQLWHDDHQGVARADNTVADGIRSVAALLAADLPFVQRRQQRSCSSTTPHATASA